MTQLNETKVNVGEDIEWEQFHDYRSAFYQEITNAKEAEQLNVEVSSILRERIGPKGHIKPHYHSVVEIIHITVGQVELLCNGEWIPYSAGDTFLVPKGVVHSVRNLTDEATEQISIFLPAVGKSDVEDLSFETVLTDESGRELKNS